MDISAVTPPNQTQRSIFIRALLTTFIVFLLAYVCLTLSVESKTFTPLWFPTAAIIMQLYRLPRQSWGLALFFSGTAICTASFLLFGPSWLSVKLMLINLFGASVSTLLLQRILPANDPLDSLLNWMKFVGSTVIFTPLVTALLAASIVAKADDSFWQPFGTWFISEAIGVLALAPIGLVYRRTMLKIDNLFKLLLILVGTLTLTYLVLVNLPFPFTFIIPPLLLAALSLPRLETFITGFAATLMITFMTSLGVLDLHGRLPLLNDLEVYLPLLLILIPAHAMAMVMHALRVEKKRIVESETRFRNALEYSAIGMALVSPEGKWLQVNQALCELLDYSAEALHHLTYQELTHPSDLETDLSQRQNLLANHISSYTLEKRYLCQGGNSIWTLQAVSLVRNAKNQPLYFIFQVEDISELKRTEAENRRLMERITLANQAGGIGIWEWVPSEKKLNWDKRMFELYGLAADHTPTLKLWQSLLLPEDRERIKQQMATIVEHAQPFVMEFRIKNHLGEIRHMRSQGNVILDKQGNQQRIIGTHVDMTEIKSLTEALHQEKERLHITLDAIGEGVISTDSALHITFMNPVAEQMCGWPLEQALGMHISSILHLTYGTDGPKVENPVQCALKTSKTQPTDNSLVLHSQNGHCFDVQESISPLKTIDGDIVGTVIVLQDVSAARALMNKLSYNASHDALTNLKNRTSFEQQLKYAIANAKDNNQHHTLVFLDLDKFKAVNDSAGHAAGDALLKEISQLMQHQLRNNDYLARLGGDEFGMILFGCALEKAEALMQQMISQIKAYPFYWEGQIHHVGACAGITAINALSGKSETLLAEADAACYKAKNGGRGQVYRYQAEESSS